MCLIWTHRYSQLKTRGKGGSHLQDNMRIHMVILPMRDHHLEWIDSLDCLWDLHQMHRRGKGNLRRLSWVGKSLEESLSVTKTTTLRRCSSPKIANLATKDRLISHALHSVPRGHPQVLTHVDRQETCLCLNLIKTHLWPILKTFSMWPLQKLQDRTRISYSKVIGKNLRQPYLSKRLLELKEHVIAVDLAGKMTELSETRQARVIWRVRAHLCRSEWRRERMS